MTDSERRQRVEELVLRHGDMVYRLAYQNTGSTSDAEDVMQEVFLSLLTKDAPLDDDVHIRYWLVRVTLNRCHNLMATARRKRTVPLDEALHLYAPENESILSDVMQLPPKYRSVIYLHYYEGYSIAEIADLLRVKPNTVGSWLSRGRKRLRLILEEQEDQ